MRKLTLVLLFAATSTFAADAKLARYWAVHIDTPRKGAMRDLELADADDARVRREVYSAHAIERPSLMMFTTDDGTVFTLRPRPALADFEKPSPLPEDVRKELSAKLAPISERAHQTLVTHHNEIWEVDAELTNDASPAAPKFALLRTDRVVPANDKAYSDAMKTLCADLASRGISVVAFFSTYGDGAYRYLFLSDAPIRIAALRTLAETRDVIVHARPDLALTEPAHWFPSADGERGQVRSWK
jgi:hypothetical protein